MASMDATAWTAGRRDPRELPGHLSCTVQPCQASHTPWCQPILPGVRRPARRSSVIGTRAPADGWRLWWLSTAAIDVHIDRASHARERLGQPTGWGQRDCRASPTRRGPSQRRPMATLGTLSQRAAVGNGPRGLQRERRRLELFPHEEARSRAYRWGEDGIAGISDDRQRLCFALALWNGRDPILKERLFGLTNAEGNHGEDVKEYYFYLDSTPTHSYMKYLYKYPQAAFPYDGSRPDQPAGARVRSRSTSSSTPASSTTTATSTSSSSTRRPARTTS